MKSTLISHAPVGIQLVTNVNHFKNKLEPRVRKIEHTEDASVLALREYFARLLQGAEGRPDCPFVGAIERNNGYHILRDGRAPGEIDFDEVVPRMVANIHTLSPAITHRDQQFDPTVLIQAFTHPEAMGEDFCSRLNAARNETRLAVMREGRMISQMHPHHQSIPGRAVGFTAPLPILAMKRMHVQDGPLLARDPASREIHERFFDEQRGIFVEA